jgi:hypothetical protein
MPGLGRTVESELCGKVESGQMAAAAAPRQMLFR